MMLIVDQNDLVTGRRIGQTDAAGARPVGDFAQRAVRRELGIR